MSLLRSVAGGWADLRLTPRPLLRQGVGGLQAAAGKQVEQEPYGAGSADPDGRSYTPDCKARSSRRPVAGGPARGRRTGAPKKLKIEFFLFLLIN
ncbi:hypothetical protein [Thermaurantimonas aggregans]|uniref:hypothetical protein n=1 Tax=Thermaurantimonas aggregans TaxID=2173829 RepID=UPI000F55FBFE|nr:hypothetical protein [Thermaurantimonas aggregans]MCX8149291.1 hypothetical protein [Thermaurantimonas aggregans]